MKFLSERQENKLSRMLSGPLQDFEREFPDEASCKKRLFEWQWPDGFQCRRCDHDEYYYHRPRELYECKECGQQASLTSGTLFEKSRTPLKVWFYMIFVLGHTNNRVPLSNFIKYRSECMGKGDHRKTVLKLAEKIIAASSGKYDYLELVKYYSGED